MAGGDWSIDLVDVEYSVSVQECASRKFFWDYLRKRFEIRKHIGLLCKNNNRMVSYSPSHGKKKHKEIKLLSIVH